jgi:hypothetical protein
MSPVKNLHIGATDADPLHVDDNLAGGRHRSRHFLNLALPRPGQATCGHHSHYFVTGEPFPHTSTPRPPSARKGS